MKLWRNNVTSMLCNTVTVITINRNCIVTITELQLQKFYVLAFDWKLKKKIF